MTLLFVVALLPSTIWALKADAYAYHQVTTETNTTDAGHLEAGVQGVRYNAMSSGLIYFEFIADSGHTYRLCCGYMGTCELRPDCTDPKDYLFCPIFRDSWESNQYLAFTEPDDNGLEISDGFFLRQVDYTGDAYLSFNDRNDLSPITENGNPCADRVDRSPKANAWEIPVAPWSVGTGDMDPFERDDCPQQRRRRGHGMQGGGNIQDAFSWYDHSDGVHGCLDSMMMMGRLTCKYDCNGRSRAPLADGDVVFLSTMSGSKVTLPRLMKNDHSVRNHKGMCYYFPNAPGCSENVYYDQLQCMASPRGLTVRTVKRGTTEQAAQQNALRDGRPDLSNVDGAWFDGCAVSSGNVDSMHPFNQAHANEVQTGHLNVLKEGSSAAFNLWYEQLGGIRGTR